MSLNTILATAPLTTTNYILKATGTTIGNSLIWDNGTNVGIGNTNTSYTLDVSGTGRFTGTTILASTSGSVGVAVTPSGWGSGYIGFQVGPAGSQMATGNNNRIGLNFYYDGGASFKAIQTGAASLIEFDGDNIRFKNAASVSGGAAQTINERLTITSAGNVGIGTSSPVDLLTLNATSTSTVFTLQNGAVTKGLLGISYAVSDLISGSASGDLNIRSNNTNINFSTNNGGTLGMRITSGGEVLIGTSVVNYYGLLNVQASSSSYNIFTIKDTGTTYNSGKYYQLYINSTDGIAGGVYHATATTVGFYTGPSDQRLKSNIKDWDESVLPFFAAAKPKTYNHIADEDESVVYKGFLAQDMVDNFPEVYGLGEDGYYQNNPTAYIPYLVKAIQELSKQNEELSNRLIKLESK
jgi:hypothetical protein